MLAEAAQQLGWIAENPLNKFIRIYSNLMEINARHCTRKEHKQRKSYNHPMRGFHVCAKQSQSSLRRSTYGRIDHILASVNNSTFRVLEGWSEAYGVSKAPIFTDKSKKYVPCMPFVYFDSYNRVIFVINQLVMIRFESCRAPFPIPIVVFCPNTTPSQITQNLSSLYSLIQYSVNF